MAGIDTLGSMLLDRHMHSDTRLLLLLHHGCSHVAEDWLLNVGYASSNTTHSHRHTVGGASRNASDVGRRS